MDLGVAGYGYLIFGGTAGMGLAAARALAADGANVAIAGRRAGRGTEAADRLSAATGSRVVALTCDLTESGAAEHAVDQAVEAFGGLRGMAVTTGLGMRGQRDLFAATDDDWSATFEDVLLTVSRACRATVPVLIEQGGGSIVTTAAYSIRSPKGHQVPYGALKAGVVTMTKALAKAYGPSGVRANCVCPGATETEVLAAMRQRVSEQRGWPVEEALERLMVEEWGMQVALGRAGRPEEVGDVMAFLLSERASYLTGATLNVDGGTDF
jgi:NAD(P)-dependent dehydrogenase (short-subunit alcohol dehydrogenase family)